MTPEQWLASDDPGEMLRWLTQYDHDWRGLSRLPGPEVPPSDRKLRLFACAVARLQGVRGDLVQAVADAEEWADGGVHVSFPYDMNAPLAADAARYAADDEWGKANAVRVASQAEKAALLRDIVGNPWQPVTLPPQCRTPTVVALAEAAYAERQARRPCGACKTTGQKAVQREAKPARKCRYCGGALTRRTDLTQPVAWCGRCMASQREIGYVDCPACRGAGRIDDGTLDPDRLGVLADALEESGCADPDIIGHLRGPGPHVRGCAILDLILGKA